MAHWLVDGLPSTCISGVCIARLAPFQSNPRYMRNRTEETLDWQSTGWPNLKPAHARILLAPGQQVRLP